ncbi:hypothetical protein N9873_03380 [Akkermansiaceae bacterium]|nr:hypothetical protein [Akkermansiaceae bacterium]MDB4272533.1 hypothetical protein [bacterium]MDA7519423.1 hypothetical protein [Akkermansiaceae bacterium]MDA7538180.1 hypothetical protein [Akkermansiaceae bacterium]MDA7629611.1 hypothetical protein [Akkermansiaceae bacterium]
MTLDISQFFVGLVLLAFVWMTIDFLFERFGGHLSRWLNRRQSRECHLCGKTYAEKPRVKLSRCPDCDGLNSRKSHRRLG